MAIEERNAPLPPSDRRLRPKDPSVDHHLMKKAEHAFSAFIISEALKKHFDVVPRRRQMIDVKGLIRIIEFR
jgi:hypothetical protein